MSPREKYNKMITGDRTQNDCAVIALALVTNLPYRRIEGWLEYLGRRTNRGTQMWMVRSVLAMAGFRITVRQRSVPKSVNQCSQKLNKNKKFLVITSRHILAVIKGEVLDWTEGRRHRPQQVWEITRIRRSR